MTENKLLNEFLDINKKKLMTLEEQIRPHAQYWDCYNDEPLEYNHTNKLVKIADNYAIEFANWITNIDEEILIKQLKRFKEEKDGK